MGRGEEEGVVAKDRAFSSEQWTAIGAITGADIAWARKEYQRIEPRDLFYRAARELIELASKDGASIGQADALAVLLKTWNGSYYRFHQRFDEEHFTMLERLLLEHSATLAKYKNRSIDDVSDQDRSEIVHLFDRFEGVLGPVGAAKALHLLAPKLCPLWDGKIARGYRLHLGKRGTNGERYWRLMLIARGQCQRLKDDNLTCDNPLKAIDEYNYCRYTSGLHVKYGSRMTKRR